MYTVDSIESTFTLDGVVLADQEILEIEQTPKGLCILLSKASPSVTPDLAICGRLSEIMGIDVHTLFNYASQPPETIEQLMRIQKIPQIPTSKHPQPPPEYSQDNDQNMTSSILGAATPDIDATQLAAGLASILNQESTHSISGVPVMAASIGNQPAPSADISRLVATIDTSAYVASASAKTSISAANNHPSVPIATPSRETVGDITPDVSSVQPTVVIKQKSKADSESGLKFQITGEQVLTGVMGESFVRHRQYTSHALLNFFSHRSTRPSSKSFLNLGQRTGRANGVLIILA